MSARFAGSRSVDERRRRRLAAETHAEPVQHTDPAQQEICELLDIVDRALLTIQQEHHPAGEMFPLRRLVPKRLLVCIGLGIMGLLLTAGVTAAAGTELFWGWQGTAEFASLFSLQTPRVANFLHLALLIASGQMAWLICWARAQSLTDFTARYRIWYWFAGIWWLGAFCYATGAHQAAIEFLCNRYPHVVAPDAIGRLWLIPGAIIVMFLMSVSRHEMRGSALSLSVLRLGMICYTVVMLLEFSELWSINESVRQLSQFATGVFGSVCVALSMVLHARHVVYGNADPPPRAITLWQACCHVAKRTWNFLFRRYDRTRLRSEADASTELADEEVADADAGLTDETTEAKESKETDKPAKAKRPTGPPSLDIPPAEENSPPSIDREASDNDDHAVDRTKDVDKPTSGACVAPAETGKIEVEVDQDSRHTTPNNTPQQPTRTKRRKKRRR